MYLLRHPDDGSETAVPATVTMFSLNVPKVRLRVQFTRQLKPCTTEIYLQNDCAHGRLYGHAPVGSR